MKRFFLLMLAMGAISFGAFAQDASKTEIATKVAKQYSATLELSDDQLEMAQKIFGEHLLSSRNNWEAADGDKSVYQESQKTTFKETDEKIKALLTDNQLKVYQEKKMELKKNVLDHYLEDYMAP